MKHKRWALLLFAVPFLLLGIYAARQLFRQSAEEQQAYRAFRDLAEAAVNESDPTARTVDFDVLRKKNPEVVAWLTVEGTPIDYPVVQGTNNQYYLKHSFEGSRSDLGTIFLDCANAADFSDSQSVLYGHNMHYGDMMLAPLMEYGNQAYYDAHPTATLYTPDAVYTVEWFSGYITLAPEEEVVRDYGDGYGAFLEGVLDKSDFESTVRPEEDDRILTLCTCAYSKRDERYLLHGKIT